MTSRRRFPNDPAAVRAARKFVLTELAGYAADLLEVTELLVSELAGNCVRHTKSSFEVHIEADVRRITVRVADRGSGRPVVRSLDPDAVAGRGLALVEMLSSSWGVRASRSAAGGKSVWFALDLRDPGDRPRMAA
jgi:anti-sigma regulatory factor (Ser/Thr protein kinase)